MSITANYIDLGLKEYKLAWEFQENQLEIITANKQKTENNETFGSLIFCEHPHVFTLGKSGEINNLLINDEFLKKIDATYYKSNRGGDITYHGPGQLVGYPVFDLENLKMGIKEYIFKLEEVIILTLKNFGINSNRLEGATGVWLDTGTPKARKICAIGVRVSRSVTMHGFALNVNTNLNYFSYINPCGFQDKGVTSMEKELGLKIDIEKVKDKVKDAFTEIFGIILQA